MPQAKKIIVVLNGNPVTAFEGDTIAAVLLAEGLRVFGRRSSGRPRGLFCGMGTCYDCMVTVDDTPNIRACITRIAEGMEISTE